MPAAPDGSPEFRAEMGALLSDYAARIAAARQGPSRGAAAMMVQSIMNEQTAAMRALMERWQATTEKQRATRPTRPAPNAPRKHDDPKPP
jgi:hypothetical protein